MERGDWNAAESLFADALRQCPANAEAHRLYAEVHWKRGRQEDAVREISEAIRLDDTDALALIRYAEMRMARGEFEQAFSAVQRAMDLDPQSADTWAMRGQLWQQTDNLERALADYHRALGHDPNRRHVLWQLAIVYRRMDEPQRALANLQCLADTYPPGEEPREVLTEQACTLAALGRTSDAAALFANACRRGEPDLSLWLQTAESQWRSGDPDSAQATLNDAQRHWPTAAAVAELTAKVQGARFR